MPSGFLCPTVQNSTGRAARVRRTGCRRPGSRRRRAARSCRGCSTGPGTGVCCPRGRRTSRTGSPRRRTRCGGRSGAWSRASGPAPRRARARRGPPPTSVRVERRRARRPRRSRARRARPTTGRRASCFAKSGVRDHVAEAALPVGTNLGHALDRVHSRGPVDADEHQLPALLGHERPAVGQEAHRPRGVELGERAGLERGARAALDRELVPGHRGRGRTAPSSDATPRQASVRANRMDEPGANGGGGAMAGGGDGMGSDARTVDGSFDRRGTRGFAPEREARQPETATAPASRPVQVGAAHTVEPRRGAAERRLDLQARRLQEPRELVLARSRCSAGRARRAARPRPP